MGEEGSEGRGGGWGGERRNNNYSGTSIIRCWTLKIIREKEDTYRERDTKVVPDLSKVSQ